ncbi:MAG TPA: hypothetical protein VKV69_09710 [Actinomycetota bacterium]|nr:hypothetical protein [Actinomycetota bacterium]
MEGFKAFQGGMRTRARRALAIAGATSILLLGVAQVPTLAASVSPTVVAGNPTCEDLGFTTIIKFDPPVSGTSNGVTISVSGTNVDWSSTVPVAAVIVKGGDVANVYYYNGATSDTGLTTVTNPKNGTPYGLSHVNACAGSQSEQPKDVSVSVGVGDCVYSDGSHATVTITFDGEGSATLTIKDGDGNTIQSFSADGSTNLPSGHYTWSAEAADGSQIKDGTSSTGSFDIADCAPSDNGGGSTTGGTTGTTGGTTGDTTGNSAGNTTGTTGSTTGDTTGGSTGATTGGSTGGSTGSTTGGSTGGSTGSTTGSTTGGSTGGTTGSTTGGSTGGTTGSTTGSTTGGSTGGTSVLGTGRSKVLGEKVTNPGSKVIGEKLAKTGTESKSVGLAGLIVLTIGTVLRIGARRRDSLGMS